MNPLDMFAIGFTTGAALMGVVALVVRSAYQRTLLQCAYMQTPERLTDGKFYYLVEEEAYCHSDLLGNHARCDDEGIQPS